MKRSVWFPDRDELLRELWPQPVSLRDLRDRLNEIPWHRSIRCADSVSRRARSVLGLPPRIVFEKTGSNDPRNPKPVKPGEQVVMPPSRTRDPSSAAILLARDVERTLFADIDFPHAVAWGRKNKVAVGKGIPPASIIAAINQRRAELGLTAWRVWMWRP